MRLYTFFRRLQPGLSSLAAALMVLAAGAAGPALAQPSDIEEVALDDLLSVQVSAAAKYEQDAREAPASVTVITREHIDRFGYRTLAEALASVRGLYVNSDLESSFLGVRGFNRPDDHNRRILVLVDGQPTLNGAIGDTEVNEALGISLDHVARIEVVRGPGSALYGTGAMHAVINVVTAEPSETGVAATVRGGSRAWREGTASAQATVGGAGILFRGYWGHRPGYEAYFEEYDAPETNDGIAEDANWFRYFGTRLQVGYRGLVVRGALSGYDGGLATPRRTASFNHPDASQGVHMASAEAEYARTLGAKASLTATGHLRRLRSAELFPILVPDDFDPASWPPLAGLDPDLVQALLPSVAALDIDGGSRAVAGTLQLRLDPSPRHRIVVGAGVDHTTIRLAYAALGMTLPVADGYQVTYSAFAQEEFRVSRALMLILGSRLDRTGSGALTLSPRAGLVYHPLRSGTLKVLYGTAFRAPSLMELNDQNVLRSFVANPDLGLERIRTGEVAWEQQVLRQVSATASVYAYRMRGLIAHVYDAERGLVQYQNADGVDARGAELGLRASFSPGIYGYASYAYQHTRDAEHDRRLAGSPAHLAKAGLALPVSRHIQLGLSLRYRSAQRSMRGSPTAAATLADLRLSTRPLWNHFDIGLTVRNVLGARHESPTRPGYAPDVVREGGRSAALSVRYSL